MEVISYLFLTHFLADYPFQPGWLVVYKKKSFLGVILHSLVHLVFTVLILFPFWSQWEMWVSAAIIFVTHVVIDQSKVTLEKHHPHSQYFGLYLLDQMSHLLVISFVSLFFMGDWVISIAGPITQYYSDQTIIHFVLVLILSTYVYDITSWTYLNSKKPHTYKRKYSMMARNALIVVIAFVLYWISK